MGDAGAEVHRQAPMNGAAGAPSAQFALAHFLTWLTYGDAARLDRTHTSASDPPFSTVTMSGLLSGNPPMRPGGLFVAVRTEARDHHDFVAQAFGNGASAALVARVPEALRAAVERGEVAVLDYRTGGRTSPPGNPLWPTAGVRFGHPRLIIVDDPQAALQGVAAWWRREHRVRVIAITGSVGKTTTKELTSNVLAQRYHVLRTEGNLNNEYGLPFTLLRLTPAVERAVVEIGISAIGEMETFARIAGPDVAVVTRVAPAHLHQLVDLDTVEREKGRLVEALPADGVAILNADDPRVAAMAQRTRARAVPYGLAERATVQGEDVKSLGFEGIAFTLRYAGRAERVRVPLVGQHFATAALAAAAVGFVEGCTWEDVVAGLAHPLSGQRMRPLALSSGVTILDDSYNASPAAMRAALDVLASCPGRRIAVLGDMFELGEHAVEAHRAVGEYVPGRADALVTVGRLGREIAAAAGAAALRTDHVISCDTNQQAADDLRTRLKAGDYVLIKGSRGMRMEEIVHAIAGGDAPTTTH